MSGEGKLAQTELKQSLLSVNVWTIRRNWGYMLHLLNSVSVYSPNLYDDHQGGGLDFPISLQPQYAELDKSCLKIW